MPIKTLSSFGLTSVLFDAGSCEPEVVGKGQPTISVGSFNIEPTKIPSLLKGISAGKCRLELGAQWI